MNKFYFAGPVLALLLFSGVYMGFRSDYTQKQEAKQTQARLEKETKLKEEAEARRKAVDEAVLAQEKRKKERAEKDRLDKQEKDARQAILDEREKAFREQEKLARQIDRLKKDLVVERESLAKLEAAQKTSHAEAVFLNEFTAKAQANVKALENVIEKIASAEAARLSAAAAAEAARKNS